MRSRIIGGAVAAYLGFGLCLGLTLKTHMRAVNGLGVAYVTAGWPFLLDASPVKLPIPRWVFTFRDRPQ